MKKFASPEEKRAYFREKNKAWRAKNPDKVKEYTRRHYPKKLERLAKPENREKARLSTERYRKKVGKDQCRDWRYRHTYGITLEQFLAKVAEQNGLCAICNDLMIEGKMHQDHDHITGELRDVLCGTCNQGLGMFRENIAALEQAVVYLRKHGKS